MVKTLEDFNEGKLNQLRTGDIIEILGILFEIKINKIEDGWEFRLYVFPQDDYETMYNGNILMVIKGDIRESGHIQRSMDITGKRLLEVMDRICIWLGLKSSFLVDVTTIKCDIQSIDLKIILLFSDCQTYYEKNGFVACVHDESLWQKFLGVRNSKLIDLFWNEEDLRKLHNLGYDKILTIGDMFKIVKYKDCKHQSDILSICNIQTEKATNINPLRPKKISYPWKSIVIGVMKMKEDVVKHYINIKSFNDLKGNDLKDTFRNIWNAGFYMTPEYRLTYVNILGMNYLIINFNNMELMISTCNNTENIQDVINRTANLNFILKYDVFGYYEIYDDNFSHIVSEFPNIV